MGGNSSFGLRIELDPLIGFAAAIFRTVAAIFKLCAFIISTGNADRDVINRIMPFHVTGGVQELNPATADKAGTAFYVLPPIGQTSALRFSPGHGKMTDTISRAILHQGTKFFRAILGNNIGTRHRDAHFQAILRLFTKTL